MNNKDLVRFRIEYNFIFGLAFIVGHVLRRFYEVL